MSSPILEARPGTAAMLVAVDGRTYPLERADIVARAEGGIASTALVQVFANPYDETLELTYTLPLPADGAVLGYTIRVGEKLIRAEVQTREKAGQAYRDAVYSGRTAGLLEQTRPGTFQQKLGNVPARTKVEITIDVLHPLAFVFAKAGSHSIDFVMLPGAEPLTRYGARSGQDTPHWEYRFPTVVGVRYHGASGRVPDQADLSPDRGDIPARVSLTLTIADASAGFAASPSHAIDGQRGGNGSRVTFREGERLDRDVVVHWEAASDAVGVRLVEGSGLAGDNGRYALVTLVPPAGVNSALHRDLTVLLDTSGSMSGTPLALAKRVVGELLNSLEAGDRFEMIEFSTQARRHTRGLVNAAPDELRKAHAWLARLQADGCTEMASAVEEALRSDRRDSQRQIVLVTDGEIGFEAEVVAKVAGAQNVRLHVVGVGSCPNRALTQQAAAAGRGLELLVGDESTAGSAAARLIAGTARPVLTNVSVQGGAVVGEKREWLRDVFAGQPLLVTVELARSGGVLEVRGDLAGSAEPWVQRITVPAAGAPGALPASALPLGALHGRSVVGELEIRRAGMEYGDTAEIESRIEALGLRHKIATSRTSLVAFEETPSADPKQPSRRVRLAVELPAGVSAAGVGLMGGFGALDELRLMRTASVEASPAPRSSMPSAFRRLTKRRMGASRPPETVEIAATDARWLDPHVLVVEFETPHDGFMIPQGELSLEVRMRDGREVPVKGTVVESATSPPGPHSEGRVVRLAISAGTVTGWAGAADGILTWTGMRLDLDTSAPWDRWVIRFHAPGRPEAPAK